MAGVMGAQVPIYDIQSHYKSSDKLQSLLVTNEHLGAGLANGFNPSSTISKTANLVKNFVTSASPQVVAVPPKPTVLMRGHGFTCIGETIEEAVFRAIYTCTNARIQTTSLLMQGTFNLGNVAARFGAGENETGPAKQEEIKYLNDRECKDSWTAIGGHAERPWKLWCAEVENSSLYRNELGLPPGA